MPKMNLEISFKQLLQFFLLMGTSYYFKYVGFFSGLLFGGGRDIQQIALEGSKVNKIFGIAIISVGFLLLLYSKEAFRKQFWRDTWIIWMVPLFCFLSFIWSVEPSYTFKRSIALFALFVFSACVTTFYRHVELIKFLGIVIAICAMCGLVLAVVMPSQVFLSGGIRDGAFIGILADKNAGARAYAVGLTILFPFLFLKERKYIVFFMAILFALALAMSASGISLAGIGIGTVAYLTLFPYSRRTNPYLQCIKVLALYGALLVILYFAKEFFFTLLNRSSDLTDRKVIWDLVIPMVEDKPMLGYGFGAFWASMNAEEFIQRWGFIGNAHNGYIEAKLDGGTIFYWIINSLLIFSAAKSIYLCVTSNVEQRVMYSISFAVIVITAVANTIAFVIPNYYSLDFLILVIFLFVVLKSKSNPNTSMGHMSSHTKTIE